MDNRPVCPYCKMRMKCLKNGHFIVETQGGEPITIIYADEFGCQGGIHPCGAKAVIPADQEPSGPNDDGWELELARVLAGPHTLVEYG